MTNEDIVNGYDLSECPVEVKEQIRQSLMNEEAKENKIFFEQYQLCRMPLWGAQELIKIIYSATELSVRNLELITRAVSLAQSSNQLPQVFTPRDGIEWARLHNYPFTNETYGLFGLSIESLQRQQIENIDLNVKIEAEVIEEKTRKKLIPQDRDVNEGLSLVYEIFSYYRVNYLDELPASTAWGKIISGDFNSDLINSISDTKKSITLNGGDKLDKTTFSDKYRRRFKPE